MLSEGQGTKTAETIEKPTFEQREHLLKYHLGLALVGTKLHVNYVLECGDPEKDKACPLPNETVVTMCRRPPCPR